MDTEKKVNSELIGIINELRFAGFGNLDIEAITGIRTYMIDNILSCKYIVEPLYARRYISAYLGFKTRARKWDLYDNTPKKLAGAATPKKRGRPKKEVKASS